jgi:hypothetical protein
LDIISRPGNDEVKALTLMTLDEVKSAPMERESVASQAMVWLAYLIGPGAAAPETGMSRT